MNEFDDILIAIHGIGEQSRNTTARSVATRLAHSSVAVVKPGESPPVAPQPLGWFYSDVQNAAKVVPLDTLDPRHALARTGFTEVFWADIPQEVAKEGRTLEETKAWARTVVARARAIYKRAIYKQPGQPLPQHPGFLRFREYAEPDFSLAAEVLDEMIDTVQVLQNLFFLAEKAGIMKFELDEVLQEYLGDVQIVTEFTFYRRDIIGRFHRVMEQIHRDYPDANLHIVAHSEGTVVSFLGLLHALSGERIVPANDGKAPRLKKLSRKVPKWLRKVNGYLTIGSPIDKHILLWPDLFRKFNLTPACSVFTGNRRIKWRNYYDYGDPVGFELDTARDFLKTHRDECEPFEFEKNKHDIGFARYMLPGKAHNDYWDDAAVFEHYVSDVIKGQGDDAEKPKTIPRVALLSPAIPYVISFLLLFAGVWVLYRAVTAYMHPGLDPLQRYVRFNVLGLAENKSASGLTIVLNALAISGFITGVTLLARLPRLAAGWKWYGWGALAFVLGCWSYYGVTPQSRLEIGHAFQQFGPAWQTRGIFLLGLLVVAFALLGTKKPSHEFGKPGTRDVPRKKRWFFRGMRPLIAAGAAAVVLLVIAQLRPHSALTAFERTQLASQAESIRLIDNAHLNREELNMLFYSGPVMNTEPKHIREVTRLLTVHPAAWPLFLSTAAFLYLWWLAALIFDLAFVWQRYIRNEVAELRLRDWRRGAGEGVAF